MTRIILQGCCGKMGRMVTNCIALFPDMEIVAGVDQFINDPPLPYPVYSQADEVLEDADVIIDFSRPDGLTPLLTSACDRGLNVVLATTGLSEAENRLVDQAAEHIAVFQAANLSVGIKAMQQLLQQAVGILGEDSDIEIVETHHNQKVDAPSGTALALADSIRQAFGEADKQYVFGRHGRTSKRQRSEIGIHALRGGTVTGEHEVFFFGQDEVLSIKHHAASRQVFAMGALKAARFMQGQAPGRYSMDDLLCENTLSFEVSTDRVMIHTDTACFSGHIQMLQEKKIIPLYESYSGDKSFFVVTANDAEKLADMQQEPVVEAVATCQIPTGLTNKLIASCSLLHLNVSDRLLRLYASPSNADAIISLFDEYQ